jgi:hypothetical protein
MKGKFKLLGHIGLALFLAVALMLMVVPASADVSSATVVLDDATAGAGAKYTITFTLGAALTTSSNSMYFRFPSDTTITDASSDEYSTTYVEVSVNGATAENPDSATVTGKEILVDMANTWSAAASSSIEVVFKENSTEDYIKNPTAAGDYKLRVHTSVETTPVLSAAYAVTGGPTKIVVTPAKIVTAKATASPKITIQLQNANSEPTPVTSATSILLSTDGTNGEFSESATSWSSVTQVTMAAGSSEAYVYYKQPDTADDATLTFSEWPSLGWTDDTVECDVTAATLNVDIFDADGIYTGDHKTGVTAIATAYADSDTVSEGTLKVRPGVYTSALTFNDEYITLESYDGADTTFINVSGTAVSIETSGISTHYFELGGDTATSGFTIMANGSGDTHAVRTNAGADNQYITIQNNKILCGSFNYYFGITTGQGNDYITIKDNTIEVGSMVFSIYLDASQGGHEHLKIEDNTFEPVSDVDGGGVGVLLDTGVEITGTEYFYIRGNTFDKAGIAINLSASGSSSNAMSGIDIYQNTITNCTGCFGSTACPVDALTDADAAIVIQTAWSTGTTGYTVDDITIEKNIITGTSGTSTTYTSGYGVNIVECDTNTDNIGGTTPITIRYNSIYDNAGDGVHSSEYNVTSAADVDTVANMNWWGAAAGPNATGGDGVTTSSGNYYYVTCDNWATQDIVSNLNAGFGGSRTLSEGWNIVSVPLAMHSTADTVAEQVSLGHLAYFSIGYTYADGDWSTITSDTVLTPCDAYYIKVTAADTLGVISSSERTVPTTKSLAADWNLISLAYLDSTSPSLAVGNTDNRKTVSDSLASLSTYASVVVSPSFNYSAWSDVESSTSNYLYTAEGYWVYMSATGYTLAGFSSTPFFSISWTTY